jgi:hypothetical protein
MLMLGAMGSIFPQSDQALAYHLDDAARLCGLSRESLYRAIKSGDLPAKRTSIHKETGEPTGRILVLRTELERWLEALPDDWWGYRYQ